MDWTKAIDIYCERLDPSFWSEPINAISNAGFVLAGLWTFSKARQSGADLWVQGLCLWVAVIGIGSFLFHTFANAWSQQADVIPIQLFIVVFTLFSFRRFAGTNWIVAVVGTVALVVGLGWLVGKIPSSIHTAVNGSLFYAPAFIILFGFAAYLTMRGHGAARFLLIGGVVFCVSLFFRSIDMTVCGSLPIGTHFLWHLFNAVLLGTLCLGAVRHGQSKGAAA